MMAGHRERWRTLKLLVVFSLLSLTEEFEVREDEWEELGPDIAALHRLQGLSEHMHHESLHQSENGRLTFHQSRLRRSGKRLEIDQNPMSLLDGLQDCVNFTACVIEKKKVLYTLLEHIHKQKVQDWLLGASEISHSYSQKLLIMTDQEKSTSDRVQQEYSMDPHYSVKVSKHCLFNESCLPEANGYTVVKIFGRVSEDGQTVSGLNGASLANLILKPSLEAAPVFSVDGNTTTEFQHNFIRVFMLHGFQTVLETNQYNHQIYQVMDQPDSVSSYKIPQRPADHTTQYDLQQIIIMEDNRVVRQAAEYLYEKHPTVSSVYVLDNNQRPRLIHGKSVPLSEDSRLVLVGHGKRDNSGEMRLAGYRSQDVAKIIERTERVSNKIKTTSVVACEVGSDQSFIETLLRNLHGNTGIETKLHVRDALIQVRHTGEKITQEISQDGLQWRNKDDSKKVVATIDRNGDVIIRNEPVSKGQAVFINERNFLGPKKREKVVQSENTWPKEPMRFVNPDVFKSIDQNQVRDITDMKNAIDDLQALTWGFFHTDPPRLERIAVNNLNQIREQFIIGKRQNNNINWINDEAGLKNVLKECFEITSGEDIKNIIHNFAGKEENPPKYLMINDWIFEVDPTHLYVYPVGKRLDNNQIGNRDIIKNIRDCISDQMGKESYKDMRGNILNKPRNTENQNEKRLYAEYVRNIFRGVRADVFKGKRAGSVRLSTEAWYTTYFAASVIAESARNFRTFPLILTALALSEDPIKSGNGLSFLFEEHSMARGGSWFDPNRRGFIDSKEEFLKLEYGMFKKWNPDGDVNIETEMAEIAETYGIVVERNDFQNNYRNYKNKINESPSIVLTPGDDGKPSTSGTLGGFDDGYITMRDLNSASELENTFKHESYFSRASALLSEEIRVELKAKYGENVAGMHLQEGTARIENGQFVCKLVSERADAEPVELRFDLSPECQHYTDEMLKNMDTAVQEMEQHSSTSSHQGSRYVEHAGTAVGALGLMLGLKGTARAFEEGKIKDGVMGALQTAHGVTAMTTSVIARKTLTSETRIAKAAASVMRSPAMKGTMAVIPVVGIGFGIYNLEQDLERRDALGYIDAVVDIGMIGLDIVELVQPELAPIIVPINLALSVVRMAIDDVYMGIQNELNSLPNDAGVLDKINAVFVGLDEGILHFAIHVASVFYDWRYDEIEEGRRLVAQISDYHQYYKVTKEQNGTSAIDFTAGNSSWNGGGITFCLADEGDSELCMDYFVSSDESLSKLCWKISTDGSKDIILGLGEAHELEHKTLQKKVLIFIPAGSVTVVSGYEALSSSRYGTYRGNRDSNRFFAVQKAEDKHVIEVMLSYYYTLYGEPGDDTFVLGPQRSYVEGSGGKDTYIIPENGGKAFINNYDPSKAQDTLHFSVNYSHISVSKSGNDVVLMYEGSHTVTIQNWFFGELYRHMNMMSGDGVLFEISSTAVSSVLVARGINKMFKTHGETVDASVPLLRTVTNIFGSQYDDVLIGNGEKNLIDGGGGRDCLIGGEGEDIYIVKDRPQTSVLIDNYSQDNKTDVAIIEANLHSLRVRVDGDDVHLEVRHHNTAFDVTVVNWFRSSADRHLLFISKDLITFTITHNKADCRNSTIFTKCIKSLSIDFSSSSSPLKVDLEKDESLDSVTEVRGSPFNDVIKGNKENNVIIPGSGDDFIEGRRGEDWYIITPGQGVKTINNLSPDRALDILFIKEQYQHITCTCEHQSIIILVHGRRTVILQNWFDSKNFQHLQVKTSDRITAGLKANISSCGGSLMLPLTIDYRDQRPETLSIDIAYLKLIDIHHIKPHCSERTHSYDQQGDVFIMRKTCFYEGKMMKMNDTVSVKEMFGSSGFDIMIGNINENLLDPYTGGALMIGGEGKDTYIIKHGYGDSIIIDNFAEDQKMDTVLVEMDFLDGSQVVLDSPTNHIHGTIITEMERLEFILHNYNNNEKHQHLEFQSSDGVRFKLKSVKSAGGPPSYQIEAFKVTLKQSQLDCRLDLSSQRNLSEVHTVQGCPSKSNVIIGNNQDNALVGGWKDDVLDGGDGDDTLVGVKGADLLIGGRGDDTLYGEDGNDTLMGNSGQDVFIPGPGADLIDGGPGRDSVLYRGDHEKGKGVYVNLLTGQGHNADAEGDVLKDVETVIGTIYSDILVSGYESSLLKGSDGHDILVSTGGDYLVGGDGNDIYMLAFSKGSVTIDNCAKDNARDILYLESRSKPAFDCQILSDKVILSFYGDNQEDVKIALRGWISDQHECGHLELVFRETKVSVDQLLQECQTRKQKSASCFSTPRSCCRFVDCHSFLSN